MATRSLNKVMLIGNLTRDPELKYTAQGTAICTFGLATNRSWTTEDGETKENATFHRIVAWDKLGEICSQLLFTGRKVYLEGRVHNHSWEEDDGNRRQMTEIVISEMLVLDSKRAPKNQNDNQSNQKNNQKSQNKEEKSQKSEDKDDNDEENIKAEDIPF